MNRQRIALVAAARQHQRRPEVAHRRQMRTPITGNCALEDRCEVGVGAHLHIEHVDEAPDSVVGYLVTFQER